MGVRRYSPQWMVMYAEGRVNVPFTRRLPSWTNAASRTAMCVQWRSGCFSGLFHEPRLDRDVDRA